MTSRNMLGFLMTYIQCNAFIPCFGQSHIFIILIIFVDIKVIHVSFVWRILI